MAGDRIAVPYNHKLKRLEALLAGVERAGDFFVQGSLDAPIPRVEIDGVGVLSFPVPASQIEAVIKRANRAPYGRGEHTIVDTSVRNAWQLDCADVWIGGKAWEKTLHQIMSTVIAGLGCSGMDVSATLYKLQVYETGGLFRPHRDTERTRATFREGGAPMKLAWLLEHQYSAAGLSFAGLKGQDAARVQVLSQAAERSGCSAHLGIVHIEETGPAEPHFDMYDYRGRRSGWHDDDPSDEEEDVDEAQEAVADDDFDVIEVSDAWHYVDHWVDT